MTVDWATACAAVIMSLSIDVAAPGGRMFAAAAGAAFGFRESECILEDGTEICGW
jgi:hypothetical protein